MLEVTISYFSVTFRFFKAEQAQTGPPPLFIPSSKWLAIISSLGIRVPHSVRGISAFHFFLIGTWDGIDPPS